MIPALLAAPVVEGVLNRVIDCFAPSAPASSAPAPSFTPALNTATAAATPVTAIGAESGTMRADQWGQMRDVDVKEWIKGLAGRHVNATDASGRTFSGTVGSVQQLGHVLALNIGGHLVSLSQLKQISWSPSIA